MHINRVFSFLFSDAWTSGVLPMLGKTISPSVGHFLSLVYTSPVPLPSSPRARYQTPRDSLYGPEP